MLAILILTSCYPKVLDVHKATSPNKDKTITVIDSANDGGIDYQLIRYIYFQDTNRILRKNSDYIELPDSGSIEVAWENNSVVHIYIEENGLLHSRNNSVPISSGEMIFTTTQEDITVKLFCRLSRIDYSVLSAENIKTYKF